MDKEMKSLTELKAEAFDNYIKSAESENAGVDVKICANTLSVVLAGLKCREYDKAQNSSSSNKFDEDFEPRKWAICDDEIRAFDGLTMEQVICKLRQAADAMEKHS